MNSWNDDSLDQSADTSARQQPAPTAPLGSHVWSTVDQPASPDDQPPPMEPRALTQPDTPTVETRTATEQPGTWSQITPRVTQSATPARRPRASRAAIAALVVLSFLGGSLGGGVVGSLLTIRSQPASNAARFSQAQTQPIAQLVTAGDIGAIFKAASPSVVEVATTSPTRPGRPAGAGTGSGFVVDAAGLILTNDHVVAGASAITVRFSTGDQRSASVVGQDRAHDLALLKIDDLPEGIPVATLGNSDTVQVGELAIAIGSPFGLEQTVTQGIISAVNRTWSSESSLHHGLIQTDAPINPGNSGGPLLNARGEVIGITTLIESPVEGNVGIGFAVPINTAQQRITLLAGGAQLQQGFMGVALGERSDGQPGVVIQSVEPGSGAAQAALQVDDVITAINGVVTRDYPGVASQISGKQPGEQITVTIERAGREQQVTVTLQARTTQG